MVCFIELFYISFSQTL